MEADGLSPGKNNIYLCWEIPNVYRIFSLYLLPSAVCRWWRTRGKKNLVDVNILPKPFQSNAFLEENPAALEF